MRWKYFFFSCVSLSSLELFLYRLPFKMFNVQPDILISIAPGWRGESLFENKTLMGPRLAEIWCKRNKIPFEISNGKGKTSSQRNLNLFENEASYWLYFLLTRNWVSLSLQNSIDWIHFSSFYFWFCVWTHNSLCLKSSTEQSPEDDWLEMLGREWKCRIRRKVNELNDNKN